MKEFNSEQFTVWINQKFDDYRNGDRRIKGTHFAKFIGVSNQVMSNWLLGKLKERPGEEQRSLIISKYGFESYEPLGLEPPADDLLNELLPPGDAAKFISALEEIRSSGLKRGNAKTSPDERRIIKDIFAKYGVKIEFED
jgi:hypothetical protein